MLTAADLLVDTHPLHKPFLCFCMAKVVEPSKRQARQFLKKYPQYNTVRQA